jgi:large subunit ribosomal protein L23
MARTKKAAEKVVEERSFPAPTVADYSIIMRPIVTEKSMRLQETENKITLRVKGDANAVQIKNAFQALFNKKVEKVNVVNVRGKEKRVGRFKAGLTSSYKKAIIKLAAGESLDLFKDEKK